MPAAAGGGRSGHGQFVRPQGPGRTRANPGSRGRTALFTALLSDFNPIEPCWSKLKLILPTLKARTAETLEQAVAQALAAITPENARAWFARCGYGTHN